MIVSLLDRFEFGRSLIFRLARIGILPKTVWCDQHGRNGIAVVCKHSHDAYHSGLQADFHAFVAEDGNPVGLCSECNEIYFAENNDPEPPAEPMMDKLMLVCRACFEEHRSHFNVEMRV